MSRNILDSAAGGAFMGKTIVESKAILESILQNYSQWHTERAPMPSRKVSSIEEVDVLSNKMDAILSYINKQNVENVPLHELVGNNAESVDVNFVRNFSNNGYGNNYNSYNKPPLTWICPLGTHGLVYRVRPMMEVDKYKDSKIDLETKKEGSNPYSTRTLVNSSPVAYIKPGMGAPRGTTYNLDIVR
jgi:hypothetical protein